MAVDLKYVVDDVRFFIQSLSNSSFDETAVPQMLLALESRKHLARWSLYLRCAFPHRQQQVVIYQTPREFRLLIPGCLRDPFRVL